MKVNVDQTVEVSDEQRKAIAAYIDGAGSKKREATRDEMKEFIWSEGASWAVTLVDQREDLLGSNELDDLL